MKFFSLLHPPGVSLIYFGAVTFWESSHEDDRYAELKEMGLLLEVKDHPYQDITTELESEKGCWRDRKPSSWDSKLSAVIRHLIHSQINKSTPNIITCGFDFIVLVSSCKYHSSSTLIAVSRFSFDCITILDAVLRQYAGTARTSWETIRTRPSELIASTWIAPIAAGDPESLNVVSNPVRVVSSIFVVRPAIVCSDHTNRQITVSVSPFQLT